MKKILIATEKPFTQIAVNGIKEIIESNGFKFSLLEKYTDKQQLIEASKNAAALIIRSDKIDAEVFEASPNLEIVVRAGAGYDNVDLQAATAHNVTVMNTPGQNSNAVAELAIAMLLYQYRNHFNGKAGSELRGKTIGLYAYGNVARYLGQIAKGFGMKVMAYRRSGVNEEGIIAATSPVELFEKCDIVSLHMPLTPETEKVVGYDFITKMKPNAVIINTARKEVINEEELLKAFEERTDLCYLTDIAPKDLEKFNQQLGERFFATPKKMGAQTAEANINAGLAAARQIVNFFKNNDITFKVN